MKKKWYLILGGGIILLIIAAIIIFFALPPSAQKVPQALTNAFSADGRFEFSCMLETDGEGREYFWLNGEKNGENRHIEGRVLGSPLELYYVDDNIYRYDAIAEEWFCYTTEDLAQAAELYAELEPAAAFAYDSLIEINYLGRSNIEGHGCYDFSVIPDASGWVADFFTDIEYIVSLNRVGKLVCAELIATLKENPDTTMRIFVIVDKEDNITIQAPECGDSTDIL